MVLLGVDVWLKERLMAFKMCRVPFLHFVKVKGKGTERCNRRNVAGAKWS